MNKNNGYPWINYDFFDLSKDDLKPAGGLEPPTHRLRSDCSAI